MSRTCSCIRFVDIKAGMQLRQHCQSFVRNICAITLLTTTVCCIALCLNIDMLQVQQQHFFNMLSWSERHNSNPAHLDKFPFLMIAHSLHVVVSRQPEVPERPLSDGSRESCEQISRACKGSLHLPCPWKTACRGSHQTSYKYTALKPSGRHAKAFRDAQPLHTKLNHACSECMNRRTV